MCTAVKQQLHRRLNGHAAISFQVGNFAAQTGISEGFDTFHDYNPGQNRAIEGVDDSLLLIYIEMNEGFDRDMGT